MYPAAYFQVAFETLSTLKHSGKFWNLLLMNWTRSKVTTSLLVEISFESIRIEPSYLQVSCQHTVLLRV